MRPLTIIERRLGEIARLTSQRPMTSFEITEAIGCGHHTTLRYLKRLEERGCIVVKTRRVKRLEYSWVAGKEAPVTVRPQREQVNKVATETVIRRDPLVALLFNKK